jgi:hypothetical protein
VYAKVLYIRVDNTSMPTPTDTPSPAPLEDRLRELEADLECLAERLNRLEHAQ